MDTDKPSAERRRAKRVNYYATIHFAAYDGQTMPPPEGFEKAETRTLSPTGISFLTLNPPSVDRLVLRFGSSPSGSHFLSARVVHCSEGIWDRKPQFLVGCEFLERLTTAPSDEVDPLGTAGKS